MDKKEMEFRFSVMLDLGDSVVMTGKVEDCTHVSKYFNHYEKALEYIKEQCELWVK